VQLVASQEGVSSMELVSYSQLVNFRSIELPGSSSGGYRSFTVFRQATCSFVYSTSDMNLKAL
jgi:hypothetical protein